MVAGFPPIIYLDAPGTSSVFLLSLKFHILLKWCLLPTVHHPPELIPTHNIYCKIGMGEGGWGKEPLEASAPLENKIKWNVTFRGPSLKTILLDITGLLQQKAASVCPSSLDAAWVSLHSLTPSLQHHAHTNGVNPTTHPGAIKGFPEGAHRLIPSLLNTMLFIDAYVQDLWSNGCPGALPKGRILGHMSLLWGEESAVLCHRQCCIGLYVIIRTQWRYFT